MLRNGQGPTVDTTISNRTRGNTNCRTLHGQRGGNQVNENTNLPSEDSPCGTQMALHQGDGRQEAAYSQRNQGQGESSGPLN